MTSIASNLFNTHQRRSTTGEIILNLFEFCDMSCSFCSQDHDSKIGMDKILEKFQPVVEVIQIQKKMGKSDFHLHLMGGELFADDVPDSIFVDYKLLIEKIREYCTNNNIKLKISIASNFVWKDGNRVIRLKEETKTELMTSYDPAGRFNASTFEIFKQNVRQYAQHISSVGVVITKPTIQKFLKNDVPFFDFIYQNFQVYLDYYGPEKNANVLQPKDTDLRDFMKLIIDTWPNCLPVSGFLKDNTSMTCQDTYSIMADGSYGGCGKSEKVINFIPIKPILEQQWFDDFNCVECQYFSKCSFGCFMSHHVKEMRTQKECWLKEVYDYIESK